MVSNYEYSIRNEIATQAGNAHEGGKIFGSLSVDFSAPLVQNSDYADSVVDLLKIVIGRGIAEGIGNENTSQTDIAKEVLNVQGSQELWEVNTDKNGNISISRKKISEKPYQTSLTIISNLDRNGLNEEDKTDLKNN
jgi:hypothetical protein